MSLKFFGYGRVSTPGQAKAELSLPDQRRAIEAFGIRQGWTIVQFFEEPGASAQDGNRRNFERMIEAATGRDHPVDIIVVHSFSRFYRDGIEQEMQIRRLEKRGVKVVSVTQPISDDSSGEMTRRFIGMIDEFNSRENAKHTKRTMLANAELGFWNGSVPPLGYSAVVVDRKGDREKKKLVVDLPGAALVQSIFRLYLEGDGHSGPKGVKKIAKHLNDELGHCSRRGKPWTAKLVNEILRRETYVGRHYYNVTDSKTGETRPREDWVLVPVPEIISADVFDRVQARLDSRNPRKGAVPALVGSPYLLTGFARCGHCGGALTASSAKSGQYDYYACSKRSRSGPTVCAGQYLRTYLLDELVIEAVMAKVVTSERLKALAEALRSRQLDRSGDLRRELDGMRVEADRVKAEIRNLMSQAGRGVFNDFAEELHVEVTALKTRKQAAESRIAELERHMQPARRHIRKDRVTAFGDALRQRLRQAPVAARKAWLQNFVKQVVVTGTEVQILA
jgi:site-specific DNA recombinase